MLPAGRSVVLGMDEPTDRHDPGHLRAGERQARCSALGARAGSIGVIDNEHSPARDIPDHPEAFRTGAKMRDRLLASHEQR
jgi:hypothetical protein